MSPDSWQDEWLSKDSLPRLVKINIQSENGAVFPEMIIELKIEGLISNIKTSTDAMNFNNSKLDQ
jgi:general secretion pathway protein J